MASEDDWYDSSADDDLESAEESIRSMPLYDEEGVEIPDNELPWNNVTGEGSPDASVEWMLDEAVEAEDNRSSAEHRKRIAQSVREEALRRLELATRTTTEFQTLVHWYDREEQSRMRRERRYESLELRDHTVMVWDFHSLILAINSLFSI